MKKLLSIITVIGFFICMFFQHTVVMLCYVPPCPVERVQQCANHNPRQQESTCCSQSRDSEDKKEPEHCMKNMPVELDHSMPCPMRPCNPVIITPPELMAVYENRGLDEHTIAYDSLPVNTISDINQLSGNMIKPTYHRTVHYTIETTVLRC